MYANTFDRRRAGLTALAAVIALAVMLAFTSFARASEIPRQGYWCGFQTSTSVQLSSTFMGSSSSSWANKCQIVAYQHHIEGTKERRPLTFYIRNENPHIYVDDFLFGEDAIQFFHNTYFGSDSGTRFNGSKNGRDLAGTFPASYFFAGTLKNTSGVQRNVYAWFVGRTCPHFQLNYWYGCS